jgi:hypothetical protein
MGAPMRCDAMRYALLRAPAAWMLTADCWWCCGLPAAGCRLPAAGLLVVAGDCGCGCVLGAVWVCVCVWGRVVCVLRARCSVYAVYGAGAGGCRLLQDAGCRMGCSSCSCSVQCAAGPRPRARGPFPPPPESQSQNPKYQIGVVCVYVYAGRYDAGGPSDC